MVTFKKMWEDVNNIIEKKEVYDVNIIKNYESCFLIEEEDKDTIFLTREDFIDFWCNMLFYNQICFHEIINENQFKFKYIYSIVKNLPYIKETEGVLKVQQ